MEPWVGRGHQGAFSGNRRCSRKGPSRDEALAWLQACAGCLPFRRGRSRRQNGRRAGYERPDGLRGSAGCCGGMRHDADRRVPSSRVVSLGLARDGGGRSPKREASVAARGHGVDRLDPSALPAVGALAGPRAVWVSGLVAGQSKCDHGNPAECSRSGDSLAPDDPHQHNHNSDDKEHVDQAPDRVAADHSEHP